MSLATLSQQLNHLKITITVTISLYSRISPTISHLPMWLTKSAGGFHVHLMHLYIFNFHSRTFTSVLLLYACASVMHLSASSYYGGPGGNIRAEAFRSNHGESGYAGHTVTGQVYTPTPLQNVNYLIRFTETASGRRRECGGQCVGLGQALGGVGGAVSGASLRTEPFDPWFLLLISHWAGTQCGEAENRILAPSLSLQHRFISLFHILCTAHL